MQSNAQKLWIPNPNANTLVDVGAVQGPDFAGEVRIVDQISILSASVTRCQKVCASPCEENIWTIEFGDVDFGDCNACGKSVGFTLLLNRNPDFDNQTYFEYNQRKQYVYQGNLSGTVTGATLATWFFDYITDLQNQNDQHDQFLVVASVGTGPTANVLTLTFPCNGLAAYSLIGIYQLPNNNLSASPTNEFPVFFEQQAAVEAVLSKEKLLQQFPQEIGHVFGEAPRDQWTWCQTVCVITLKGCIDACSSFFDNQNSGHLHTGATPFDLLLYVNSAAPGFADFIADLNGLFNPCDLDTLPGFQSGVQGPVSGINVDSILANVNTVDGSLVNITVGSLSFSVTLTSQVGTDFANEINAIFGAGTAVYSSPNLQLTAPIDVFGSTANISIVTDPVNYVGE
jgi:hypothetical protein